MGSIDGGIMTSRNQQDERRKEYERPEIQELGTVEDLTCQVSSFNVST